MTHVKQVEAFERLVTFCTGYGGSYNPGRPTLQIDALQNQLIEVKSAIEKAKLARTEFDSEVNQRKQAFDQLPKVLSGILRTLEASGAKPEKMEDARAFVNQIMGASSRNRKPIPSEQAESKVRRTGLQLAYASKVDAFSKLIQAVTLEPLYQPREKQYAITGLTSQLSELILMNQKVDDARAAWRNALLGRNNVMYRNDASLTELARAVRKYVRAVFGLRSGEYAFVKALQFTRPSTT